MSAERDALFLRQLNICPPDKLAFPITVIGAGAIGSATVVTLAKMGCSNITVWDDDILEPHNSSNQICKLSAMGKPKVEALKELVEELTGVVIHMRAEKYKGQKLSGVVVVGTDSMASRQEVWDRVQYRADVPRLFEARMGAEFARVYSVNPSNSDHVELYGGTLYADSEAQQLPCSARAIIYCPTVIGGLMSMMVKKFAMGEDCPWEVLLNMPTFNLVIGV